METAHDRLVNDGPLPEDVVRAIGKRMLTGLRNFHRAGMAHMDIKAQNVALMTTEPSSAVIIDYGSWMWLGACSLFFCYSRRVAHLLSALLYDGRG